MKKILLILTLCIFIQNGVMAREITFKDRITHPIATIIHSFAWLQDPLGLIPVLNGGVVDPRGEDMVRYHDYVTGKADNY